MAKAIEHEAPDSGGEELEGLGEAILRAGDSEVKSICSKSEQCSQSVCL